MISHASDDLAWLNVGGCGDASILIEPIKDELISVLNTDESEDFPEHLSLFTGGVVNQKTQERILSILLITV